MKYQIIHRTRYTYEGSVTVSHHLARLAPRTLPGQTCPWHELKIEPTPVVRAVHIDSFGNTAAYFEVEGKHERLEVTARSLVEIVARAVRRSGETPAWETVRDACLGEKFTAGSEAGVFRFASPMVPTGEEFATYARPDFPPGRPVLEAVSALTTRIFEEFKFDSPATDVTTPVDVMARVQAKWAGGMIAMAAMEARRWFEYCSGANAPIGLGVKLREVAEEHLLELRLALDQMVAHPGQLTSVDRQALMAQAQRGETAASLARIAGRISGRA